MDMQWVRHQSTPLCSSIAERTMIVSIGDEAALTAHRIPHCLPLPNRHVAAKNTISNGEQELVLKRRPLSADVLLDVSRLGRDTGRRNEADRRRYRTRAVESRKQGESGLASGMAPCPAGLRAAQQDAAVPGEKKYTPCEHPRSAIKPHQHTAVRLEVKP